MKKLTGLLSVILLLSGSLLAANPAKTIGNYLQKGEDITFSSLPEHRGILIKFRKGAEGRAVVLIYDKDKNVLRKDVLSKKSLQKGYVLNTLENGDYVVEVMLNKEDVKKEIHVYHEGDAKMFIIKV